MNDAEWEEWQRLRDEIVASLPYTPRLIHCDDLVLHAPGECTFCDEHGADLQELCLRHRINFAGHHDPDKALSPAERMRPNSSIHRWGGNRPHTPGEPTIGYSDIGYAVTPSDLTRVYVDDPRSPRWPRAWWRRALLRLRRWWRA